MLVLLTEGIASGQERSSTTNIAPRQFGAGQIFEASDITPDARPSVSGQHRHCDAELNEPY